MWSASFVLTLKSTEVDQTSYKCVYFRWCPIKLFDHWLTGTISVKSNCAQLLKSSEIRGTFCKLILDKVLALTLNCFL